jgi:hypothetical protein
MKKLFGLWSPEGVRRFHAPVQNITSSNRSADSSTAKYVIFENPMHSTVHPDTEKSLFLYVSDETSEAGNVKNR